MARQEEETLQGSRPTEYDSDAKTGVVASLEAAGKRALASMKPVSDATVGAAERAGSAMLKAAETTGGAARRSAGAAANALDALQSAYSSGVNTVFPDCPVPAFMLPTGPGADDYLLVFDLDEFMESLQAGVLKRPSIDLWAATADGHDVRHLAQELAARFTDEFGAAMQQIAQPGEAAVAEAQSAEDAAWQSVGGEAGKTLRSWALWTGFGLITSGVATPFMLGAGMRPRMSILGTMGKYRQARSGRAAAEKELEREVRKLEREFKRKQKPFERAVGRLEIHEHPELQAAAAALRGLDAPVAGEGSASAELPDVTRFLEHPAYRQALAAAREAREKPTSRPEPQPDQSDERSGLFRRIFG